MGLDSVELILEIEDSFGIAIPDAEASRISTIDDMYQCVLSKIKPRNLQTVCATQHVFYRLRPELMAWSRSEPRL